VNARPAPLNATPVSPEPRPHAARDADSAADLAAIDFETATTDPESACAIGVVRVERGRVVRRFTRLIRPPERRFEFTYLHGISWRDVKHAATFEAVWADARPLWEGVSFLAAHNASFDANVVRACCRRAGMAAPRTRFECTVALARRVWGIYPTGLAAVARALGIALRHHDAGSDANACAEIVIRAGRDQAAR
jgi:DNA polymerase-3 subunit epsilon